jgi:pimeloyl-ACP methyl ester carboxylesterase
MTTTTTALDTVEVDGLKLAYRSLGDGPPVLLLHGWPTSSFLWREVMPPIARANRAIALDLPGFGGSDKPLEGRYAFEFFDWAIDGFLDALGHDAVAVAGHDIGGPIAMHWALGRPERVTRVALLNTLVYPEFSPSVMEFVATLATPSSRDELTAPSGLAEVMRLGLADESHLTDEVLAGVVEPFGDDDARLALAKAGIELQPDGFGRIARALPGWSAPLWVVYGEQDRILPDIAATVARLRRDVPHAEVTALPGAGHFLQEEAGAEVGELLAPFFAADGG